MGKELKFIQSLHNSTKRNYLERMNNDKVKCMKVAKKYSSDYWDGERKYGYGGYKYIKDRWKNLAKKLIKRYDLSNNSKIIDLGCGKGYLLYEIKNILPEISILGLDISKYAITHSKEQIRSHLKVKDIRKKLGYKKNQFDLAISLGTIHNFNLIEIKKILRNINYFSKQSYIMVESFRNSSELFNLQCWALTCETFIDHKSWSELFQEYNSIDFEYIYFKD